MRKLLLILIILPTFLLSQNFISPSKQWNVLSGGGISESTEIYKIEGDTLVDSILYYKLWISHDSLETLSNLGLLREESDIVYFMPSNSTEGVLYDFSLEVGDSTMVRNVFCEEIPITVVNIDTVEYSGILRKRWHLNSDFGEEIWIEGIGSVSGLVYTYYWHCIICPYWYLLCFHDNDVLEYIMPGGSYCYINTVGIDENQDNGMETSRKLIKIIDLTGREVSEPRLNQPFIEIYDDGTTQKKMKLK